MKIIMLSEGRMTYYKHTASKVTNIVRIIVKQEDQKAERRHTKIAIRESEMKLDIVLQKIIVYLDHHNLRCRLVDYCISYIVTLIPTFGKKIVRVPYFIIKHC
jgi:hypothetical protein